MGATILDGAGVDSFPAEEASRVDAGLLSGLFTAAVGTGSTFSPTGVESFPTTFTFKDGGG